jgi:signal transduction histidine kinase/ActR/RegA family two-component response regulator
MIRRWLRRMPSFSSKVIWLLSYSGGLAVLLVSIGVLAFAYHDLRSELTSSVESYASMVAVNSGAPLVFDDARSAEEALASFRTSPHVAAATVFDGRGERFAAYQRRERPGPEMPLSQRLGTEDLGEWQVRTLAIDDAGERRGFLQVVYDLRQLERRVGAMLVSVLLIALGAMALIYVASRAISTVLVRPVAELARTAREISETRRFDLRVESSSADEIGQFTIAFNQMLDELQKRHSELVEARGEAERASRLKDEFLATLSHELRTPMAPILGWSQILQRATNDPARVRQGAEIIERNARIQTRIIDDLLDMSRIISGKLVLDPEALDLAQVVRAAIATVQPAADARGVRMQARIADGLPALRGDPNRLQQVFWNLLSNAIKFTPRGGRVEVLATRIEDRVRVEVRDDGEGMAPAFVPHVFERFRQADSSTTRSHGGLGLGLAIVKQLVEQHGGAVAAASEGPGRGSCFSVELPVPDPQAAPAAVTSRAAGGTSPGDDGAVPRDAPRPRLDGTRILVVDDEADARDLMQDLLSEAGAEVVTAASAREALVKLQTQAFELLLSDIGMPGTDGYQLIGAVRALGAAAGGAIPAIALTAFARAEDRRRALDAGFQRHLAKPVDADVLVEAVAACVDRAAVR